jgi:peptidylprolyl isomerase
VTTAKLGDIVKVHYTGTLDDGTVFDSSKGRAPLEFTVGEHSVIPGFEHAVIGLGVGDKKSVSIAPDNAYGQRREENVIVVQRSQLPKDLEPKVGKTLNTNTSEGTVRFLIAGVEGDNITLDANHPLAGEQLHFELELVDIASGNRK